MEASDSMPTRPPRDDVFRSLMPGAELRSDAAAKPVMFGHFTRFGEWAEIDSAIEGHFLERVAAGACSKTIAENTRSMRVLFHHGRDATLGVQVLGSIDDLREDDEGAYYEVGLFAGIPALVLDGLRHGVYGSSHRFSVKRDEWIQRPKKSEHNPRGLPERTLLEMQVKEFGPTPFPAFAGATSGVRSMTDEMLLNRMASDPDRFDALAKRAGISVPAGASWIDPADREVRDEKRARREYSRCVEYVGSSVWAMHPPHLAIVMAIIGERSNGNRPSADEIQERLGIRSDPIEPAPQPGVAVIPFQGPVIPKADLISNLSGGGAASLEDFRAAFRAALKDPDVGAIMLDIDSPGGSVQQVPETAAEILAARGEKPIVAQVTGMAASAAYWIASACDEIVVTPSGDVGSIGVYSSHTDLSAAQEQAGIKTTLISAGEYKVERNPFEPLSEAAATEMQSRVDEFYKQFVSAVADGRAVSTDTVLSDFGSGRLVMAPKAVELGMADKVDTYDATLARLGAHAAEIEKPEPSVATTSEPEPEPSVATTPASSRGLFWFTANPMEGKSR